MRPVLVQIGEYTLNNSIVLAPMAGLTDLPFRKICQAYGAGAATGEMLTSNWQLWRSQKSSARLPEHGWPEPRIAQIAGSEPQQMAEAARRCVAAGAQIIDINMGCPAKKVCKKVAGSALLRDEIMVAKILTAVVKACSVPVTLKMRTGWDREQRNAVAIAAIAVDAGIQALAIHGRTKACLFNGQAEYDTIAEVVSRVAIPVFANGDITSPTQAKAVMAYTGAAGLMIGRGAQGQPWIFAQIQHLLETNQELPAPDLREISSCIGQHLSDIRTYYDAELALRLSRKHITPYLARLGYGRQVRRAFNLLGGFEQQDEFIDQCLSAGNLSPLDLSHDYLNENNALPSNNNSLSLNNNKWNQAA